MDRALLSHAAIAGAASLAALLAWVGPSSGSTTSDSAVMISGSAERVSSVEWREDQYEITVERVPERKDATRVKVTKLSRTKVDQHKKGDGHDHDDQAEAAPQPERVSKWYPGSEKASKLFEKLMPLTAGRSLKLEGDDKLKELGLDKPQSTLSIALGDETHEVQIGNATYGSGNRYAQVDGGGIYLLRADTIASLRSGASSLLDRHALGIKPEEIRRIEVNAGQQVREIVQRYPEDRDRAFYADPAVPDEKLEQVSNWIDRLLKMRVTDVAAEGSGEKPKGTPELTVEYFGDKGSIATFRLWKAGERVAMAMTERFAAPVFLSKANAEVVLKDLEEIFSEGK